MKIRTWKEIIKMLKKNEEDTEIVFIEDITKKDIINIYSFIFL